jgi:hypothetical protein
VPSRTRDPEYVREGAERKRLTDSSSGPQSDEQDLTSVLMPWESVLRLSCLEPSSGWSANEERRRSGTMLRISADYTRDSPACV